MAPPEQLAREHIDRLLGLAGWAVQDMEAVNLPAAPGIAARERPLNLRHGFADDLLHVDGRACGVVAAKKLDSTLTGVEPQPLRQAVLAQAFGG